MRSIAIATFALATFGFVQPASADCLESYRAGQRLRTESKLVEARRELVACSQDACPAVYRRDCVKWLGEVDASMSSIALTVRGEDGCDRVDATVSVDGDESILKSDGRPVPINPGPHELVVRVGEKQQQQTVVVAASDRRVVLASFAPAGAVCTGVKIAAPEPPPEPPPPPVAPPPRPVTTEKKVPLLAYVLGGVGVAGLGVGLGFGVVAWGQKGDLDDCKGRCGNKAVDRMQRDFRIADISIGVGVLALAAAVIVYVVTPRVTTSAR